MVWWKLGKRTGECAKADWVGEELARIVDPDRFIEEVREWHNLGPSDLKPFIALGALSLTGARIALAQKSIVTHVDRATLITVHHSFCSAMVWNYGNAHHLQGSPAKLVSEVVGVANKITDVFYANSQSKPPLPLPHWFACKEMIAYLQNGKPATNPEEIMHYSEHLSICMRTIKIFVDELLKRKVTIV